MNLTKDQKIQVRETLKAILSNGESQVVFEKADGTIRSMRCTRDADTIPSDLVESTVKSARRNLLICCQCMTLKKNNGVDLALKNLSQ